MAGVGQSYIWRSREDQRGLYLRGGCEPASDCKSCRSLFQQHKASVFALIAGLFLLGLLVGQIRQIENASAILRPPNYASLGEIELKRLELLTENMRPPLSPWKDKQSPPGVALVFLTLRGVRHRTLWQRWFEDAYAWLEAEGLETSQRKQSNTSGHRSNVIRGYVHHPRWLDPLLKNESVPAALRPGIIDDSVDCIWQKMNTCFHRGLKEAVEQFKSAEWFYTVATDAVPLKSFGELYTSLMDDPRSRLEFARMAFDGIAPKVFNWVLLTREYASVLVRNPDEWVHEGFKTTEEMHWQAGSDEWAVWPPLIKRFGEDFFRRLHPGIILLKYAARPLDSSVNTFACWGSCDPYGTTEGSIPPLFRQLNRSGYERMHSSGTATHARKFDIHTVVQGCPVRRSHVEIPKSQALALEHIRSRQRRAGVPERRESGGRDRAGLMRKAGGWSAASFGPFFSDAECTITEFVSWRLNLNSSAEEDEEHEPLTLAPPGHQWFKNVTQQYEALVSSGVYGVRPEIIAEYSNRSTPTRKPLQTS